jgi:hypothetical protein
MTATISPTLASGPPMYATGPPTNPSSGRVEGAAGTNELGSVRTVPPPAGAAVQRRHQEVGPPHAPSATAPSLQLGHQQRLPGYRGWAAGQVRDPGGDRPPSRPGDLDR